MKKAGIIFIGAGAWPSIGIFWGLLMGADLGILQAVFFAILYALGYTIIAMGAGRVTKLDYGLVLFWAVGLGLAFTNPSFSQFYLIRYFSTFLYLSLFVTAYVPMVFGAEPFTMAFAKQKTPNVFWNTDLFMTINRIMTLVWSGLFLVAMLITLIPGLLTQIILPIAIVLAVGIPLNVKFPDVYLKARGMGGMKTIKPAPTEPERPVATLVRSDDKERKKVAEKLGAVKNVHVVFGSPRGEKGATFKLLQRFLDGIREGGIEPEIHFLNKYKIMPCKGCFTCWTKTPGVCIHKDDMPEFMEKLKDADLVIYAQPLYVFSVPGITKNFLDRQIPLLKPFLVENSSGVTRHPFRQEAGYSGRMLVFSVCGFPEVDHFDALIKMFRLLSRSVETPIIGEILRPSSESIRFGALMGKRYERVMDALFEAGRQVVTQGFVSRETEQAIARPLLPDVQGFRQIANQFWNTWIDYEKERKAGKHLPDLEEYLANDMGMLFGGMAASYNPERAGDFEAIYQFHITGDREGKYSLKIKNHECNLKEGEAAKPDVIIHTPWDVWRSISRGEISGQDALMKGQYRVEGDLGLMLKMQEIFSG